MIGFSLLSGGIDSAVVLAIAKEECDEVLAVHFDYGQATRDQELENSRYLAEHQDIELIESDVRQAFGYFCSGTMEKKRYNSDMESDEHGQSTGYVHMRNLLLLSIAGAIADSMYSNEEINLYIGAQIEDEELYPDCRPEFLKSTENALDKSTLRNNINIEAPLLDKTKAEIIELGNKLEVPLGNTISCYNLIDGKPCMECPACLEREKGFKEAGIDDPSL
ncbi:7-cyano-7-deazaguanine synthase [Methanonatronarchaeum sp. AMET-Sl]|uniref:7-cyano-7-deazaguanine synthase n=1 Tax=Methanonatronarchaeum sp. AMET-Sl TaxID=3037654 RepID=UPI00244DE86D|nr:7-cyano-7-deazaguanine synthase [Methanonatronarchaeum sp. AMET-Sl]WGI17008.1 7-cyano-7-deazaguanine synthase [Methanonatronarchaeum sp. AMET-Sl]